MALTDPEFLKAASASQEYRDGFMEGIKYASKKTRQMLDEALEIARVEIHRQYRDAGLPPPPPGFDESAKAMTKEHAEGAYLAIHTFVKIFDENLPK